MKRGKSVVISNKCELSKSTIDGSIFQYKHCHGALRSICCLSCYSDSHFKRIQFKMKYSKSYTNNEGFRWKSRYIFLTCIFLLFMHVFFNIFFILQHKKVKCKVFINLILLQYIFCVGFIILCNGCVSSLTFIYILNQQLKIYVHWKQNKPLKAMYI